RSRARSLVRQIHRSALSYEIFIPTHSPVRRGFPGLAAETASVDHEYWNVPIAIRRDLILHVHLVYRHLAAARQDCRPRRWSERFRFAANEKAALACDNQRFLQIVPAFRVLVFVLPESRYGRRDRQYQNGSPVQRLHHVPPVGECYHRSGEFKWQVRLRLRAFTSARKKSL